VPAQQAGDPEFKPQSIKKKKKSLVGRGWSLRAGKFGREELQQTSAVLKIP
jgi:hypothetical protein